MAKRPVHAGLDRVDLRDIAMQALREAGDAIVEYVRACEDDAFVNVHMKDTPQRYAQAMMDMLGNEEALEAMVTPMDVLKKFDLPSSSRTIINHTVVSGPHPFSSLCAHHLLPFIGVYVFGYTPAQETLSGQYIRNNHVVGLSKIPRFVKMIASRPNLQERIGDEVCERFNQALSPQGCIMWIRAMHACMCCRGVATYGPTTTLTATGIYQQPEKVREFLSLIDRPGSVSFPL